MHHPMTLADGLVVLGGYAIGSVPFAHLAASRAGVQLRDAGSGNVGATNVWRTVGQSAALVVLLLDVTKGTAAVVLAHVLTSSAGVDVAAAVAAVVGHVFPVWLRFRGGKGVATSLGAFMLLAPVSAAIGCGAFAVVLLSGRIVALASLVGTVGFAAGVVALGGVPWVRPGAVACTVLIFCTHRANIGRMFRGVEPQFTRSR